MKEDYFSSLAGKRVSRIVRCSAFRVGLGRFGAGSFETPPSVLSVCLVGISAFSVMYQGTRGDLARLLMRLWV